MRWLYPHAYSLCVHVILVCVQYSVSSWCLFISFQSSSALLTSRKSFSVHLRQRLILLVNRSLSRFYTLPYTIFSAWSLWPQTHTVSQHNSVTPLQRNNADHCVLVSLCYLCRQHVRSPQRVHRFASWPWLPVQFNVTRRTQRARRLIRRDFRSTWLWFEH